MPRIQINKKEEKMKKFLITAALIICMLPMTFALVACAEKDETEQYPALTFILTKDDTYNVKGRANGKDEEEIVIPATVNGKAVAGIALKGFSGFNKLKKITIPQGMDKILSNAFENCSALTEIVIPDSVTVLSKYAFNNCTSLTKAVLGSGLKSVAEYAFAGCGALTELTLPSALETIDDYAFSECSGLSSVRLPETLEAIGKEAFSKCSGISEIKLPASLLQLGDYAFGYNNGSQYPGKLLTAYFYGPLPQGINQSFGYSWDAEGFKIYVPEEHFTAYSTADAADWKRCVITPGLLYSFNPEEIPY